MATVRVSNTGNTAEKFFVDARGAGTQTLALAPLSKAAGIALPMPAGVLPTWLVPTEANTLVATAAATLPVQTDLQASSGNPEVVGPSVGNTSTASVRAAMVAQGLWTTIAGELGPFTPTSMPGRSTRRSRPPPATSGSAASMRRRRRAPRSRSSRARAPRSA
jgi:hypothetical protein